jgi:23S rRNA pseudouridine1911/1915/1917 synthase
MPKFKVPETVVGQRIDLWLVDKLKQPRSNVQRLIKDGRVLVGESQQRSSYHLRSGDTVKVELPEAVEVTRQSLDLPVLYQDDDIVVIDKPAGLMVHPARADSTVATVADFARPLTSDTDPERPGIVHRLDSDTSGVLLLARTQPVKEALQKQFRDHTITKTYVALVMGRLKDESAVIKLPLARSPKDPLKRIPTPGGKAAETTYRVLEEFDGYSLVEVLPKTGRTHQIRAHMAALGHPIAGDRRYGGVPAPTTLKRQFLHAVSLELELPSGKRQRFEAPLADDLALVLAELRHRAGKRV